jgi:hypothetical protein
VAAAGAAAADATSLEEAWALLKAFTAADARGGAAAAQRFLGNGADRAKLRDALMVRCFGGVGCTPSFSRDAGPLQVLAAFF